MLLLCVFDACCFIFLNQMELRLGMASECVCMHICVLLLLVHCGVQCNARCAFWVLTCIFVCLLTVRSNKIAFSMHDTVNVYCMRYVFFSFGCCCFCFIHTHLAYIFMFVILKACSCSQRTQERSKKINNNNSAL